MELFQMPLVELPLPSLSASNAGTLMKIGEYAREIWGSTAAGKATDSMLFESLNDSVFEAFSFTEKDVRALKQWKQEWSGHFEESAESTLVDSDDET